MLRLEELLAARHELGAAQRAASVDAARRRGRGAAGGDRRVGSRAAARRPPSARRSHAVGSADGDGAAAAAIAATAGAAAAARGSATRARAAIEAAQAEARRIGGAKAATVREHAARRRRAPGATGAADAALAALAAAEEARGLEAHFHSIVLLVKMLLNHRRNPENALAAELYDEVVAKRAPSTSGRSTSTPMSAASSAHARAPRRQ